MDNDQIKHMVNRFLMWKLPEHFRPDCGIIYTPIRIADGRLLEPSGTNLLDATQAEAMVRHMIEGLPAARPSPAERESATDQPKGKVNETAENLARMELQGTQRGDISARPELVADHAPTVPQDVPLRVDSDAAVAPSPSPAGLVERLEDQGVRLKRNADLHAVCAGTMREAAAVLRQKDEEIARLTRDDKAIQEEYAFCRKRLLIVADEKIAAEAALEKAREVIRELANTADDIGVKYFDTDDMAAEAVAMQEATLAARAFLASQKEG